MARWLIDLDGVVIDSLSPQLSMVNARFGTDLAVADATHWDTRRWLTDEQREFMWGEVFASPDFHRAVEPLRGALFGLRSLVGSGHTPVFVTDRDPALLWVTREWLGANDLGGFPLLFTDPSGYGKADAARDLGLEVAVEDAPHNARELAAVGRVWLFDYPYNRNIVDGDRIARVGGWDDLLARLEAA